MLTENDYNILSKYEQPLKTSQLGYIRGLYTTDINQLVEIGQKNGIKTTNKNCSSCILELCKKLGNLYFEYKQTKETPTNIKTKTKKTKNIKK